MQTVMIVEDDLMIADCLEEILVEAGYTVCAIASRVDEAISMGEIYNPDLAVIDLHLANGGNGAEVGAAFRALGRIGIVYVSGNPDTLRVNCTNGDGCVAKPYSATLMIAALLTVSEAMLGLLVLPPLAKSVGLAAL